MRVLYLYASGQNLKFEQLILFARMKVKIIAIEWKRNRLQFR